jgi:hypothetical protein
VTIRLRLVTRKDPVSDGIRFWTSFAYSHVEAVTPEGLYFDKATLRAAKFIDLPAGDAMTDAF